MKKVDSAFCAIPTYLSLDDFISLSHVRRNVWNIVDVGARCNSPAGTDATRGDMPK